MTKDEFIRRIDTEKIEMGQYIMVLNSLTDESLVRVATTIRMFGKYMKHENEVATSLVYDGVNSKQAGVG